MVLTSLGGGGQNQPIAARQWAAGFLPSRHQGVHLRGRGEPVMYLDAPPGVTRDRQGAVVETVNALNAHHAAGVDDPEIATRVAQYEMPFQMQARVPELMAAGLTVAFGQDCVMDPWYPLGSADMLEAAGMVIAYHGVAAAERGAYAAVRHGDLTTLLFFQGYRRADFVSADVRL